MTIQEYKELSPVHDLHFEKNDNRKMLCLFYTSVRMSDSNYVPGTYFNIYINGALDHKAVLILKKTFLLDALPEVTAYQECGCNLVTAKNKIKQQFKDFDLNTQPLDLLLLKNLDIEVYRREE